jgi:hypothetical protein
MVARISPEREALALDLYRKGETVKTVCATVPCGTPTLYRVLREAGIERMDPLRVERRRRVGLANGLEFKGKATA